jgi:hypothetical protein
MEKIFLFCFSIFVIFLLVFNFYDYKHNKYLYYECFSKTKTLKPLSEYEYKVLQKTNSLDHLTCEEKYYTRFYVNLIKKD